MVSSCRCGKTPYKTRALAQRAKGIVRDGGRMHVYRCPEGNGHHLGHPLGFRNHKQFKPEPRQSISWQEGERYWNEAYISA